MIKVQRKIIFFAMFVLFTVLITVIAACGNSNTTDTTSSIDTGGATPATGAVEEDTAHSVILVNLHLDGTTGGPAYDVYQVPNGQALEGLSPAVRGLAYGDFSETLHPGRQKSNYDTGDFGLTFVPAGKSTVDNIAVLPEDYTRKLAILAISGSGRTGGAMSFYDSDETSSYVTNALPAPTAGKVTLIAATGFVGDENAGTALSKNDTVLFGTQGKCLASNAPSYSGDAATAVTPGAIPFLVDAGTAKASFWTTKSNQYGSGDCAGKPLAEADISKLKPGSRAMVFLYGPSADKVSALVVPVPD